MTCTFVELDEFMSVLDSRQPKHQKMSTGMVAKKVRKQGAPSDSLPPSDAPSWALNNSASMYMYNRYYNGAVLHVHVPPNNRPILGGNAVHYREFVLILEVPLYPMS